MPFPEGARNIVIRVKEEFRKTFRPTPQEVAEMTETANILTDLFRPQTPSPFEDFEEDTQDLRKLHHADEIDAKIIDDLDYILKQGPPDQVGKTPYWGEDWEELRKTYLKSK